MEGKGSAGRGGGRWDRRDLSAQEGIEKEPQEVDEERTQTASKQRGRGLSKVSKWLTASEMPKRKKVRV